MMFVDIIIYKPLVNVLKASMAIDSSSYSLGLGSISIKDFQLLVL